MSQQAVVRPRGGNVLALPAGYPTLGLLAFTLAHAPLAYLLYHSPRLATAHAVAATAFGLWAVINDRHPLRVIYVASYVAGAELLWRMSEAQVFHEFGKYAVSLLLALAILKWHIRLRAVPLLYFLPLVVSSLLTLDGYEFWAARQEISFNLSGPLSLAIAATFFSGIRLDKAALRRVIFYAVVPVVGIAFQTFYSISSAMRLNFTGESNFAASAGYGPNQVSAALGMGAFLAWVFVLLDERSSKLRWFMLGLTLWFLTQALLTFSRGGVINFVVSAGASTLFLARGQQRNVRAAALALLLLAGFAYVALPEINEFTGGRLEGRYGELGTTNRATLAEADVAIWQENFWFGVGPGMAKVYREEATGIYAAAHTEFSRLLSEHGVLGLTSLLLLAYMFALPLKRAPNPLKRGVVLGFMLWSLVEMSHAAMRVVAISYLFALPLANIIAEEQGGKEAARRPRLPVRGGREGRTPAVAAWRTSC